MLAQQALQRGPQHSGVVRRRGHVAGIALEQVLEVSALELPDDVVLGVAKRAALRRRSAPLAIEHLPDRSRKVLEADLAGARDEGGVLDGVA